MDFTTKGQSDVDLWPRDLKNNRGLPRVMTNKQTKFEDSRPNRFYSYWSETIWLDFTTKGQSDLDLLPRDLKNNRGLLRVMTNKHTEILGQTVLQLLIGNHLIWFYN